MLIKRVINKDEVMDELIEFMLDYFKVREIREIAEAAEYDVDKIKKAYDYMLNYNTTVEVPVAFMIDCVRNEYYANVPKKQIRPKNSFNNFEQRQVDDFAELERKLLDN